MGDPEKRGMRRVIQLLFLLWQGISNISVHNAIQSATLVFPHDLDAARRTELTALSSYLSYSEMQLEALLSELEALPCQKTRLYGT